VPIHLCKKQSTKIVCKCRIHNLRACKQIALDGRAKIKNGTPVKFNYKKKWFCFFLMLYGIAQPGIGVILVGWMSLDFIETVFPLASLHHAKGTKIPICRDKSPVIEGSVEADLRLRLCNIYISVSDAVFP
jgi:hypothetical protein